MKKIIILILGIFLIASVSASITCQTTSYEFTYNSNSLPSEQDLAGAMCHNDGNETANLETYFPFGNPSFFIIDSSTNSIGAGDTKGVIKILLDQTLEPETYYGFIILPDDQAPIEIQVNVEGQIINPGDCQINPSIVEYNQDFQQGAETTETITFNPQNCNGEISISGANVQGGVIVDDDGVSKRKPVSLGIVTSNEINIKINTKGLPPKTYDGIKLTFNAFGNQHTIRFKIGVSGSAGGSEILDINNLPKCSLTNNIINLNDTHSLVCTNLITDIEIIPIVDNEYIRGLNLEREANQWSWTFQGKKFGNTMLRAGFYYLGVPIGDFFEQELKIQSASGQTPGTSLILSFLPKLSEANDGDEILIQILDNKTSSLVENPELYIDSVPIKNTTGKSFRYVFEVGKNYEIRAISPGYNNLIQIVNITKKPLEITLTPNKEFYSIGDSINITTNVNETDFLLDNVVITSPYTFSSVGIKELKAVKEGYLDKNISIEVKGSNYIVSCSPNDYEDWGKGDNIVCELNKNATWNVYFSEQYKEDGNIYFREAVLLETGDGKLVKFKIKDLGNYEIKADDLSVYNAPVEKKAHWYNPFSWDYSWTNIKEHWLRNLIVVVLLGGVGYYYLFYKGKESDEGLTFVGQPQEE